MRSNRPDERAAASRAPSSSSPHFPVGTHTALAHNRPDEEGRSATSAVVQLRQGLWDPASGRFNPVRLRAAIVSRGWTVAEFAVAAGVSRACLYNALRAWSTSDRTAIRIATTLATREPLAVLITE
jgi:lambda repressor-like predicted transcriptional regulator